MKRFFSNLNPVSFFTFCALLFSFIYNLVTPPLLVPDEFNHFYRSWQISDGGLLPERKNNRLGGEIPFTVSDFALHYRLSSTSEHQPDATDTEALLAEETLPGERTFRDFPNTAYYSPVSYLPQALAIKIARVFSAPVIIQYYAGRLIMVLLWVLAGRFVLRRTPAYHWLLVVLLLLPMNIYLFNSFSADTVTNLLSLLLFVIVLRCTFDSDHVSKREQVSIFILCLLLSQAKLVYVPLVLLVLLIPQTKFSSKALHLLFVFSAIIVPFAAAYVWSAVAMENYLSFYTYHPDYIEQATLGYAADYHLQKQYMLAHPLYFPMVLWRSLFTPFQPYLASYIGYLGAYQDVVLHPFFYWLAYGLIFVIVSGARQLRFSVIQVLIIITAASGSVVLLLLSQHLTWDRVGMGIVELMQGRYLTPVMPLLLVLCSNSLLAGRIHASVPAFVFVFALNVPAALAVYNRYTKEPFDEVNHFRCDTEQLNAAGDVMCSGGLIMEADSNISTKWARSGRQSMVSSNRFPYTLQHGFDDMNGGDLIEIELWKKGEGISLVLLGENNTCDKIYIANNKSDYTGKDGWEHIHMVYKVPEACRNIRLHFLIHNPGGTIVYIDDLHFITKKTVAIKNQL